MQYIRSFIFVFLVYFLMAVIGIAFAIPTAFSRNAAFFAIKLYIGIVIYLARVLCGIRVEQRGQIPTGDVVVVSKHQSFFDVMLHAYFLPRFSFVMKQELRYAPIFGFYAMRIGAAPVNRGAKSKAINQMMNKIEKSQDDTRQLVIYPQGTRVPPGEMRPYKIGAGVIVGRTGKAAVIAATNVGLFWPKKGIMRKPGVAVIEYLENIESGLPLDEFMAHIETRIETETNRLMREAGFEVTKT